MPALGLSAAVEADGQDPLADTSLPFAFRAEADALDIAGAHIPGGEATPLVLTGQGTLDLATMSADATADLTIAGGKATYAGTVAAGGITGTAEADFADIAPLAELAGLAAHGGISASADGSFAGPGGLDLKVDGRTTGLDVGEPALAKFISGETRFAATVSSGPDDRIALSGLTIDAQGISVAGDVALAAGTLDATLAANLADLSLVADGSTGAASVKAKVAGPIKAPNVDATVTVPNGALAGQSIADGSVRFEGSPGAEGWNGKLTLGGKLAGQELGGTARLAIADGGGIALPEVDLTIAGNHLTGRLDSVGAGQFAGTLDLDASDLKPLAAMLEVEASGAAKIRATLAPQGPGQGASVAFSGGGLTVQGVDLGMVNGNLAVSDALGTPAVEGKAEGTNIAIDTFQLDTAIVTLDIANGATRLSAVAKGPDIDLNGDASLDTDATGTTIHVSRLEGTAYGFPVKTAAPADIVAARGGETRLSGVTLAAGGGRVLADGMVAPQLDLKITVDKVDGSFIDSIAPDLGAAGTVTGSATVKGASAKPAIAWQLDWTDFAIAQSRSIGLPPVRLTAKGSGDQSATSLDANLAGGGLAVAVTGNVPFSGGDIELSVSGKANGLDVGQPILARLFTGETSLAATVTVGSAGKVAVNGLSVESAAMSATGDLSLDGTAISGAVEGKIADLGALAPQSRGAMAFSANISGSTKTPNIDATVAVADGVVLDQPVRNASVEFAGAPTDGGWRGALTLAGELAGRALSGTAKAELAASGGLSFPEVDLTVAENHITGAIERTAAGLLSGSLDVDAPDIRSVAALLLVEANGSAQGRVSFTPDGDQQSVTVAFSGRDIALPSVAAKRIDGKVEIANALAIPMIRGHAEGSALSVGTLQLDSASVTASVENGATKFEGAAKGPEINLAASGSLSDQAGAEVIRLTRLTGSAFGFPVELAAPATVTAGSKGTSISDVRLVAGGGRVSASGTISPALNLKLGVNAVAGSFVDRFSQGLGAEGSISGGATVTGTTDKPKIAWQLTWTGFGVAASRSAGLPALALAASGNATATASSIDATLAGGGLSLSVTGNVPYAGSGLSIRAQGTAPLALLAGDAGDLRVTGTTRLDISVSGSTAKPSITGTFDLVDAAAADASQGIGVTGVSGRVRFDGSTARIERLSGRLTQGGDIAVAGTVTVDPAANFPADLTIRIRNGRYIDGTLINTSFNADLTLTGPVLGNGTIGGRVDLLRTEVLLPDSFGGGPPITVEHINVAPGFVPPMETIARPSTGTAATGGGGGGGLNLGITLNSTSGIFVRGFGLDAELGGSTRLEGTIGAPRAVGGFQMRRGRIQVLGRRFDFSRGNLTFTGSLDPVLDFVAATTTADITATVTVSGPASDPDIVLTSSPALPEEEIISRILFGRSIGSLSAVQALQLVDAIAEFSGAYGRGNGVFARLRQTLGLDDLDIQQNAEGGTTIGVGKRITNNVSVGVQTETNGTSKVTIDLDLTKNLKAQVQGGADGSGRVGLTYEREY